EPSISSRTQITSHALHSDRGLPETVGLARGLQRLVEDGEAGEGRLLADDQRRVDADGVGVGHGDEPPPQAFLVQGPRELPRDGLLALAVSDQLDPEHEALAADLADAP